MHNIFILAYLNYQKMNYQSLNINHSISDVKYDGKRLGTRNFDEFERIFQ